MQILEISSEINPHNCRTGGETDRRCTVSSETTPNGDVEIVRNSRDRREVLTVIPKSKRAALAQFLVEAI